MTDYTPTTGEVMTAVVTYRAIWGPGVQPPATRAVATAEETAQYVAEWMRWLAQVRAVAWDEGHESAAMRVPGGVWHDVAAPHPGNPYRKAEQ